MSRLSEQEINAVRAKANIVEVIAHYIPINRKGRSYSAVCPFHDDHDPSMSISAEKQIFKCFVCNTGGNVFSFVQQYEHISFVEAVYKVAHLVGVELEQPHTAFETTADPHTHALHRVCADTIEFTHYQLRTPDAQSILQYLHQRGLNDEIIDRFELGYNPLNDALYRFLHAKKHTDEHMLEAGVVRMGSQGINDVFFHRIMIPIHDESGQPVGFTARRIKDGSEAKYINTQETKLYHKGELIFNYHRAKSEARKAKCAYLVEGAMDVLALEKLDYHNALATLGTACTKEQLKLLRKLGTDIVVCYDGDQAGKNATYKFGKLARGYLPFTIVDNKSGLDPDEIIEAYGKEELEKTLHKTISWIDFLFAYLLHKYDLENYTQKKDYAKELAEEIAALSDDFEKKNYYIRLRELTGFDMEMPAAPSKHVAKGREQKRSYLTYPKSGVLAAEYEILSQMLHSRNAAQYFKDELGYLLDDDANQLALQFIDYYRTHTELAVADFLNTITIESLRQLLLSIADWELASEGYHPEAMKEAVNKLRSCMLDKQIEDTIFQAQAINDPLEKAKLAEKRIELIRERNALFNAREE